MLLFACQLLFVDCCLCLLFVASYPLLDVCCVCVSCLVFLLVVRWRLLVVGSCVLVRGCWLLVVLVVVVDGACCALRVAWCVLIVACCVLLGACCVLRVVGCLLLDSWLLVLGCWFLVLVVGGDVG